MEHPTDAEEEGAWAEEEGYEEEEGYYEEEGWEEEAAAPTPAADDEEEEGSRPRIKLTEEEEIAQLEATGWVNTSKVKGPPTRLAPKPPPAQEKMAAGKKDTWQQVTSTRNWAEDVDLDQQQHQSPNLLQVGSGGHHHGGDEEDDVIPPEVSAKYDVLGKIGRGPFSVVWEGRKKNGSKDDPLYALKIQRHRIMQPLDLERAREALQRLHGKSSHVSQFVEVISFAQGTCFVLQHRHGRNILEEVVDKKIELSEKDVAHVMSHVLRALEALRENQVLHLGVTTDNLLVSSSLKAGGANNSFSSSSSIILEGFTLSQRAPDANGTVKTPLGKGVLHFQSPEVVFNTGYSYPADVWSAGVVMYVLLSGSYPFHDKNVAKLKLAIKKGDFTPPPNVSPAAQELLSSLLKVDPAQRPTPAQALTFAFFKDPSSAPIPNIQAKLAALLKN